MNIVKNDIDSLNAEIKISLGPADYELKVSEGIKKIQKQSKMPGFRPGKVPGSLIKKQYGNQILVEEINKILNDAIYKFKRYEDSSLRYMGYSIKQNDRIGLFDTVIKKKDLVKEFVNNPRPY
jgi:trigger factor